MTSPPSYRGPSLVPEDSSVPQHTPPEDRVLRRAMDAATLDLIRGAATAPVQLAELSAQVVQLRGSVDDLRASAGRTEGALERLIVLQERANELRAEELGEARSARLAREEASREAARWWRSLVTPQGVIYLVAVLVTILGALLGVGHLIPQPRTP